LAEALFLGAKASPYPDKPAPSMIYKLEASFAEPEIVGDESGIITALHHGDEKALATIFNRYYTGLFYFGMRFVKDHHAAEDIVAESFIKIWQKAGNFSSFASIRSFLYITVKNACLDYLKKSNRHTACHREIKYLAEKTEELFADQVIKAELLQKLWQDIEQLPPVRRQIFKMIYVEGLSAFETATKLQISVDTVRVQKARALHALRINANAR
jgi:RNA polymerase sigma-70 factor (family 1)